MNEPLALDAEYVTNIPWERSPEFLFIDGADAYLETFGKTLEKIPSDESKISFIDDFWDFNPYMETIHGSEYKFYFSSLPENIRELCKFWVLHEVSGKKKISTIHGYYQSFKSAILYIIEHTNHKNILLITEEDIENERIRRNLVAHCSNTYYLAFFYIYSFLHNHCKMDLPVKCDWLWQEGNKWQKIRCSYNPDKYKTPDIPDEYFDIILNKAIEVMRNTKAKTDMRMTASAIIVLSQTGLRISDILSLTTDGLKTKKLVKTGVSANFIHFAGHKASHAHQPLVKFDIFCTEICAEAIRTMEKLRKKSEISKGNNFLFVLSNKHVGGEDDKVPYSRSRFNASYKSFFKAYLKDEASIEWEGIDPVTLYYKRKKGKDIPCRFYVPTTKQFRVHVCTVLYNNHIRLDYIQKYMGHLSTAMQGYYVRPKNVYQENLAYSKNLIKEIVQEDTAPLGGNSHGEEIKENIKKFIADKGFNVETDIDAILESLGDKVIIRGKEGGCCIKTSLLPCSRDAHSDEIMCAYGLCPNLFCMYNMVDVTYNDMKTLQDTYNAMAAKKHVKEAQKELYKMKDLINRRLIPELDELDRVITVNGASTVLDWHPSLIDIIENRSNIRKEAQSWLKL